MGELARVLPGRVQSFIVAQHRSRWKFQLAGSAPPAPCPNVNTTFPIDYSNQQCSESARRECVCADSWTRSSTLPHFFPGPRSGANAVPPRCWRGRLCKRVLRRPVVPAVAVVFRRVVHPAGHLLDGQRQRWLPGGVWMGEPRARPERVTLPDPRPHPGEPVHGPALQARDGRLELACPQPPARLRRRGQLLVVGGQEPRIRERRRLDARLLGAPSPPPPVSSPLPCSSPMGSAGTASTSRSPPRPPPRAPSCTSKSTARRRPRPCGSTAAALARTRPATRLRATSSTLPSSTSAPTTSSRWRSTRQTPMAGGTTEAASTE